MIRQFDLLANPSPRSRLIAPFVMVVQSHLYDEGPTLLVAPLVQMPTAAVMSRVSLPVVHNNVGYIPMLSEMGAIDCKSAGAVRGSLLAHEDDIRRALDRLFTGF